MTVLVIFAKDLPKKKQQWWRQFDTLIAPRQLEFLGRQYNLTFIDIDGLIDPGNIQEASELTRKLSLLTTSDGRRVPKIVNYEGFELWWIHYDDLMYKFCLPYTQYARLLDYLKSFSNAHLYKPPFADLFQYFLSSHNCKYAVENKFTKKLSFGILLQVALSILFLLWVKIRRPKLMLWSGDFFDPPRDYDFRMMFIYKELQNKKINFVEFIRSMESFRTVMHHALKRKRPVIYSFAVGKLTYYLANLFNKKKYARKLNNLRPSPDTDPMKRFWFEIATSYISGASGDMWSIKIIKVILKFIGIKVSIIPTIASRNFHEVLACKLLNIKITGIQHGLSPKYHVVSDFMPEFDGKKMLSVDKYGLWSEWWKQYYIRNSMVYKPEQLFVSGLMRPLQENTSFGIPYKSGDCIKVLFVAGQLSDPREVMPYLWALIRAKNISVYLTFRPYRDDFEKWLRENHPEILEKIVKGKILHGNIHEAITQCDVVVGCYSTGVLEALLQLKPMVFFQTNKWGDYYELKSFNSEHCFFAENPQALTECVEKSVDIPEDVLKTLQNRFFGDPHMNGSKWVVEQVEGFL